MGRTEFDHGLPEGGGGDEGERREGWGRAETRLRRKGGGCRGGRGAEPREGRESEAVGLGNLSPLVAASAGEDAAGAEEEAAGEEAAGDAARCRGRRSPRRRLLGTPLGAGEGAGKGGRQDDRAMEGCATVWEEGGGGVGRGNLGILNFRGGAESILGGVESKKIFLMGGFYLARKNYSVKRIPKLPSPFLSTSPAPSPPLHPSPTSPRLLPLPQHAYTTPPPLFSAAPVSSLFLFVSFPFLSTIPLRRRPHLLLFPASALRSVKKGRTEGLCSVLFGRTKAIRSAKQACLVEQCPIDGGVLGRKRSMLRKRGGGEGDGAGEKIW